jgi:glucose-1-phosphate adenylyltransferase
MASGQAADPVEDTIVMLLAGGQGERLYPLTRDRAKPAVPFGGPYRIIDFTLSNCLNSGLRRINVLVQYKSASLNEHIARGWSLFNPELGEYLRTTPPQQRTGSAEWYKGTADAIYQNIYALDRERPRWVLILSGDHVYKMDYRALLQAHVDKRADLTISCLEVERAHATELGVAEVDADLRIVAFHEKSPDPPEIPGKPGWCLASMGVYAFGTEALVREVVRDAKRHSAHDFGKNLIPEMVKTHRVCAYNFAASRWGGYWRDIGLLDAYWQANMDLVSVAPPFNMYEPDWPVRTTQPQQPPAKFVLDEPDGRRGMALNSTVSTGCIISGATVRLSILSPGVHVHSFAEVENSIIFDGVDVGRGCRIRNTIIDKRVKIPAGEQIGYDLERDRARFTVTAGGVVAVPKEMHFEASPGKA